MPILISQYGLRSLNAVDPDLARRIAPVRDDAVELGQLSSRLHGVDTPAFRELMAGKAGFVVYQNQLPTAEMPKREDFNNLVPPSSSEGALAVTCSYFGDALGVFITSDRAEARESAQRMAAQIEAAAAGNATCVVR
jgi:hypothetical protein